MKEKHTNRKGEDWRVGEMLFSSGSFPEAGIPELRFEECKCGRYTDQLSGMKGWLCPVSRLYFRGDIPAATYYNIRPQQVS